MEYDKERGLNTLGDTLRKEYKEIIVDFIVYDAKVNTILVQKRSMTRNMFPGAWEFPGGHLEPNESLVECIKRVVYEEAQMHLKTVVDMAHIFTWDSDKDVVNLQFLVNASGKFIPNKDKISEYRLIGFENMNTLLEKGKESQIYRGAFYAFEYIEMLNGGKSDSFSSILFFDQMITGFFDFVRCHETPPKIVLGREQDKKFSLDKEKGILSIAPSFLRHYDNFGCASIILHLIFHNYRQNILSYDEVKAIRSILGKNVMFHVDIIADVYTFLFLERYYHFTESDYLQLCHQLIKEYQAEDLESSKFARLLGSNLTIASRIGQAFNVVLPAIEDNVLHIMRFDASLSYRAVKLDKALYSKSIEIMTKPSVSEKDFKKTINKIITLVKQEK